MSALGFMDQSERLERIVRQALEGTTYQGSQLEESGRHLLLEARRPDGRAVSVRFRGLRDSIASDLPPAGSLIHLRGVTGGGAGCLMSVLRLLPIFRGVPAGAARVRIEAGAVRLDIVCEDAEWWEEETPPAGGIST